MRSFIFYLAITLLLFSRCSSSRNKVEFYNYEVECMGVGNTGTQLIKAWGYGNNTDVAINQAKKNAVHAIIFKGIAVGRPGCMQKPLTSEVHMSDKQKDYFKAFFMKGGRYLNFVNLSGDGSINPNDRLKVGSEYKIGVTVSVNHHALRKELESDGIIRKLDSGF